MTLPHDDATGPARRASRASTTTEEALVSRLQGLSTRLAATPDEEFRAATRARLVAMAAARTPAAEGATRRPPATAGVLRRLFASGADAPRRRTRLTAGLAGAALTVTALGGLLGAAQGARPGDLLYDLKRGGEQTQLALAGDSRGTTLLGFASTRLVELQELVRMQPNADAVVGSTPSGGAAGPDVDLVLDTLKTMDAQTSEGTAALTARAVQVADGDALGLLTGWAADQQSGLSALAGAVPTGAQDALTAARDLVGQVATRGADLQAALRCAGGPSTSGTDELGPVPGPCPDPPPAPAAAPQPSDSNEPTAPSAPASDPSVPSLPSDAAGSPAAPSVPAPGSAGPAASTGAARTTSAPAAPTAGGLPSIPVRTASRPGLPVPLPSLPVNPGAPAPAPTTAVPPVVSVPPPIPGLCVSIPLVPVC